MCWRAMVLLGLLSNHQQFGWVGRVLGGLRLSQPRFCESVPVRLNRFLQLGMWVVRLKVALFLLSEVHRLRDGRRPR